MVGTFEIRGFWEDRPESVQLCAQNIKQMIADLAKCDVVFNQWFEKGKSNKDKNHSFQDVEIAKFERSLNKGRNRYDFSDEVIPKTGFRFGVWNGNSGEDGVSLSIKCGSSSSTPSTRNSNSIILVLPRNLMTMRRLGRLDKIIEIFDIIISAWHPGYITFTHTILASNTVKQHHLVYYLSQSQKELDFSIPDGVTVNDRKDGIIVSLFDANTLVVDTADLLIHESMLKENFSRILHIGV